jgi:hypothetical protein
MPLDRRRCHAGARAGFEAVPAVEDLPLVHDDGLAQPVRANVGGELVELGGRHDGQQLCYGVGFHALLGVCC